MKKLLLILLVLMLTVSACGGPASNDANGETDEPFKVAALIPGPINDGGWNASCYAGLQMAEEVYGAEIAYSESVPVSDFEELFRSYAQQGYDVIIGHGFEFGDAAALVALEYPETFFLITDGNTIESPNVVSFSVLAKEAGFLGGAVTSILTETGTVGIIGGLSIPPITASVEGFEQGAHHANPDVRVLSTLTGSFGDVVQAAEMAEAFVTEGADILMHSANESGLAVIETAQNQGILAIGMVGDQQDIAPDTIVVSARRDVPAGINYMIGLVKSGEIETRFYPLGVAEDVVSLIWNDALAQQHVSEEQLAAINSVVDQLRAGDVEL